MHETWQYLNNYIHGNETQYDTCNVIRTVG